MFVSVFLAAESLVFLKEGVLHFNKSALAGRSLDRCDYRWIEWENDNFATYSPRIKLSLNSFPYKPSYEFFKVSCYVKTNSTSTSETTDESTASFEGQNDEETSKEEGRKQQKQKPKQRKRRFDQFFAQIVPKEEVKKRTRGMKEMTQKKGTTQVSKLDWSRRTSELARRMPCVVGFIPQNGCTLQMETTVIFFKSGPSPNTVFSLPNRGTVARRTASATHSGCCFPLKGTT